MPPSPHVPRITKLRLPPRRVPLALSCRALLNLPGAVWAAALAVSIVHIAFFSGDDSLLEVARLRLHGVEGPARVEAVEATRMTVGGEPIARVVYSFRHGAGESRRETYDFAAHWRAGDAATALYLPDAPEVSRLRGEKRRHPGIFGSALFLFPLAAVLFGVGAWRRGVLEALLLREGLSADARLLTSQRLPRRVRGGDVYRCTYEFETLWGEVVAGSCVGAVDPPARASAAPAGSVVRFAPDEAPRRAVLYLPRDASVSTLVDELQARYGLRVDPRGEWVPGPKFLPLLAAGVLGTLLALAAAGVGLGVLGFLPDIGR